MDTGTGPLVYERRYLPLYKLAATFHSQMDDNHVNVQSLSRTFLIQNNNLYNNRVQK